VSQFVDQTYFCSFFTSSRISIDTIKCIIAQDLQRKMKNFHGRLTTVDAIEDMYTRYKKAVSNGEDKGSELY